MKLLVGVLVSLLCCSVLGESTLELVQVFFRHGSRTPEEKDTYPLDPYTLKDFYPMGWGHLTNSGKLRAYQLGQMLRKRYDEFLGDVYLPEEVHAQSTDFARTKMSLQLVLAGLYPPSSIQQWHEHLDWMPIPYHVDRADIDYFLRRPTHYCPAYLSEMTQVFNDDGRIAKILNESQLVREHVATSSGRPMNTLMDVFSIYQTLNAEEMLNLTLPSWTRPVYPTAVHTLGGHQCYFENASVRLKRLNGGRSLQRALQNIAGRMDAAKDARKIYLYSGHENNVVNVLSALSVFEPHVPKYSAAVVIELHKFAHKELAEYKVKVLYVRDVTDDKREPEVMRLEGCDAFCPYQQFIEIIRPVIPLNYTAECGSSVMLD